MPPRTAVEATLYRAKLIVARKTDMNVTQYITLGNWDELKGQVRQQWGKVTDDDLAKLSGKTEELVLVLQQRYGYGKAQADIEIKHWIAEHEHANHYV
jgi:uncharacterized protein YjbJ (UPF0337 family)